MLVLSRKSDESVVLSGPMSAESTIKVTVLDIKGGRIRLGFEAHPSIGIHREEVWQRALDARIGSAAVTSNCFR